MGLTSTSGMPRPSPPTPDLFQATVNGIVCPFLSLGLQFPYVQEIVQTVVQFENASNPKGPRTQTIGL